MLYSVDICIFLYFPSSLSRLNPLEVKENYFQNFLFIQRVFLINFTISVKQKKIISRPSNCLKPGDNNPVLSNE